MKKYSLFILCLLLAACTHFAEGPAPKLGTEMGSLDPVIAEQIEKILTESGAPSMAV